MQNCIDRTTYSPEDNKLRIYPSSRLPAELYVRLKSAGFRWAPRQELFVAPAWSPERADICTELAGDIDDEDTSLVERADERADRFEEYSVKRRADAEHARQHADAISDGIPFGQPILVGHHSERHARRHAEQIRSSMGRAVKMWETSKYWIDRAKSAIHHAKYKERPDVRTRRIRKIESEIRKHERDSKSAAAILSAWERPDLRQEFAEKIAGLFHGYRCYPIAEYPRPEGATDYEGEISLWHALHDKIISVEQARDIATPSYRRAIEHHRRWQEHLGNRLSYERAMLGESGGTVADQTGPEKGGACRCWASPRGGWSIIQKVNKISVTLLDNWGNGGKDFKRTIPFDKLTAVMTKAEVDQARAMGRLVSVSDRGFILATDVPEPRSPRPADSEGETFEAMRESLRAGVQVVAAPQLFPTPGDVVERMIEYANLIPGQRILEPSAGTGAIVAYLVDVEGLAITAAELNLDLADRLRGRFPMVEVCRGDFLEMNDMGEFSRVLMNPPFRNGDDIKHIRHALDKLSEGGRLVAICANGPRQQRDLMTIATHWEELPEGTFDGTGVRAAMIVIDK